MFAVVQNIPEFVVLVAALDIPEQAVLVARSIESASVAEARAHLFAVAVCVQSQVDRILCNFSANG